MFKKLLMTVTAIMVMVAITIPVVFATDVWYRGTENQRKIETTYYSGASTLDHTLAPNEPFLLLETRLRFATASTFNTLNLTMDLISGEGSTWNSTLYTETSAAALSDIIIDYSDKERFFESGDGIQLQWANAGSVNYGITLKYELK